jgi:hypothetical protein
VKLTACCECKNICEKLRACFGLKSCEIKLKIVINVNSKKAVSNEIYINVCKVYIIVFVKKEGCCHFMTAYSQLQYINVNIKDTNVRTLCVGPFGACDFLGMTGMLGMAIRDILFRSICGERSEP